MRRQSLKKIQEQRSGLHLLRTLRVFDLQLCVVSVLDVSVKTQERFSF